MNTLRKRLASALAATAVVLAAVAAGPASASAATTTPAGSTPACSASTTATTVSDWCGAAGTASAPTATHLTTSAAQPLASVHSCKVAGNDGTTQGVFCADIIDNGNGTATIRAQAFCQNLSNLSLPQCADINFQFEGGSAHSGIEGPFGGHFCGHTAGACPSNQRFIVDAGPFVVCDEVWTVILSGARIQLPGSDKAVTLSANFASAHTTVC